MAKAEASEAAEVRIGPYVVHPYRAVIPEMDEKLLATLIEDTKARGQLYDFTVDRQGRVIDGRAILRACLAAGIKPKAPAVYDGDDIATFVAGRVRRAIVSKAEYALIAARLMGPLEREARERQMSGKRVGKEFPKGKPAEIAARAVGNTNHVHVRLARDIIKTHPEIVELIEGRFIKRMAHVEILCKLNPRKLKTSIAKIRAGEDPSLVLRESKPVDDLWLTPEDIVVAVREAFGGEIKCDPCAASKGSVVRASVQYTERQDGLNPKNPWYDRTFVNPPFSKAKLWVERALQEHKNGKRIFVLLPVRPDSDHQVDLIRSANDVLLLGSRVAFGKPKDGNKGVGRVSVMIAGLGISTKYLVEVGLEGIVVESQAPEDWSGFEAEQRALDELRAAGQMPTDSLTPEEAAALRAEGAAYAAEVEENVARGRAAMKAVKERGG